MRRAAAAAIVAALAAALAPVVPLLPPVPGAGAAAPPLPVVGLTTAGSLVRFDASTPGAVSAPVPVQGMQPDERLVAIDVRPSTGDLLGVSLRGGEGRLRVVDPGTGFARPVGGPFATDLAAGSWAMDVDPVADRVRLVHAGGRHLLVDPVSGGLTAADPPVPPGSVAGIANDRSAAGTVATTAYAVDPAADELVTIGGVDGVPPPSSGALVRVGPLGLDAVAPAPFDIAPARATRAGTALLVVPGPSGQRLATVDLRSGAASPEGDVGADLVDLAVLPPTPAVALGASGTSLVRFDAWSPGTASAPRRLTGLGDGEVVVGIDVRPATGQLLGVAVRGDEAQLRSISVASGATNPIGPWFATGVVDGAWSVDVDPVRDRVRLVEAGGTGFTLDPTSGSASAAPVVVGAAALRAFTHDRSVAGSPASTLFAIDVQADALVSVGAGGPVGVGALGVDVAEPVGLDVASATSGIDRAVATVHVGGASWVHVIDLSTGSASPVGQIGAGTFPVRDVALLATWAPGASQFTAVDPVRLLDTRVGGGPGPGPGDTVQVQVTGSVVPVGASAVVLNVVGTEARADGFLTVYPPGEAQPLAANQNLTRGQTRGNLVTVKIGAAGRVNVFTQSGAHVVVDVFGYYAPPTGTAGRFTSLPPARLLDTRTTGVVPPGGEVTVPVTGRGGIRAAGVASVVVNVTATEATGPGYVTGHASGRARPFTASLNVERAGQTIGNLAVLPVGADGSITFFSQSGTHLVVDVAGWFGDASSAGGGSGLFVPLSPTRVLDTRGPGWTKPGAGATLDLRLAGAAGIPAAGAAAVVANLTAVEVTAPGFVTVDPAGVPAREVSSLYGDTPGQIIPSLVSARLGAGGAVTIRTNAGTHLVMDLAGWYTG